MKAELHFKRDGEPCIYELNSDASESIGSSANNRICVDTAAPLHARLGWQVSSASFVIEAIEGPVVLAERLIAAGQSDEVSDNCLVRIGDFEFRFVKVPDRPFLSKDGVAIESDEYWVPLGTEPLIIGRSPPAGATSQQGASSPLRLNLDPADRRISRDHTRIEWRQAGHWITDVSSEGTLLNGMVFSSRKLIWGDRFRIRDYIFEYRGNGILWLGVGRAGALRAEDIEIVVPTDKGPLQILHRTTLSISPGQFIGIIGVSGQGKSTLMNALCGLTQPTKGAVFIDDRDLGGHQPKPGEVGLVPQDDIVHRELTARDAIDLAARLRLGLPRQQRIDLVDAVIGNLGLREHAGKQLCKVSGGQRKRASIATELLAGPSILFLDEPSSGLDPYYEGQLMALLQTLRHSGLTVICTTHVLQNAHLLDRICVLHAGRLVFMGRIDAARDHFFEELTVSATQYGGRNYAAHRLEGIYDRLMNDGKKSDGEPSKGRSAEEWEQRFLQSPAASNLRSSVPGNPPRYPAKHRRSRIPYFRAILVLLLRQWKILASDKLNLLFLVAQAIVIGALVGWVSDSPVFRLFLCLVATLWFGCSNGAQQIVGELPILKRERVAGLGINSYVQSKVLFFSLITVLQAALLFFTTVVSAVHFQKPLRAESADFSSYRDWLSSELRNKRHPEVSGPNEAQKSKPWFTGVALVTRYCDMEENILDSAAEIPLGAPAIPLGRVMGTVLGWRAAALALTALTGVMLGLTISALVRSSTQAVLWVPLVLIPQILFGGFVVKMPEMLSSVREFCQWMPSFAGQRIMDVSHIFGQRMSQVTNKTKVPVFVSDSNEEVVWETFPRTNPPDRSSETYERARPHNVSWQNLAVSHSTVGRRNFEKKKGEDGESYNKPDPDNADRRLDVVDPASFRPLPKRALFVYTEPATRAAAVLFGWIVGCYGLIFAGIRFRR